MENDAREVLAWLGTDSQNVPYWLHPLNLVWSCEGSESDLLHFQQVALRLQEHRPLWAAAIQDGGWRETLAGCTCLLAAGERSFFQELCDVFKSGTWVSPQVAVTLALLHPQAAQTFFEDFLHASETERSAKQTVCAQRVLERLGAISESDITLTGWPSTDVDDVMVANEVILEHWSFWTERHRHYGNRNDS